MSSLEAAAKLARHYQTKPGTTATVFEVREVHPDKPYATATR